MANYQFVPEYMSISADNCSSVPLTTNSDCSSGSSITMDNNSSLDASDLISTVIKDSITTQLAIAGSTSVATSTAIEKRNKYSFEVNPSIRERHRNRLMKNLRCIIDEYSLKVGQQAVVIIAKPGLISKSCKIFGAKPLENIVKNFESIIIENLEKELTKEILLPSQNKENLFELPRLAVNGVSLSIDQMTQAQLRAFIPLVLKYSTKRGKPGWGKITHKPEWWPDDSLPFENVRSDRRSKEQKKAMSWTKALRHVVINCYKFHDREDLLYINEKSNETSLNNDSENSLQFANDCEAINTMETNSVITLPINTEDRIVPYVGSTEEIIDLDSIIEEALNEDIITIEDQQYVQNVYTETDEAIYITPIIFIPSPTENMENQISQSSNNVYSQVVEAEDPLITEELAFSML